MFCYICSSENCCFNGKNELRRKWKYSWNRKKRFHFDGKRFLFNKMKSIEDFKEVPTHTNMQNDVS